MNANNLSVAQCDEPSCDWPGKTDVRWLVDCVADIHRGVYGHSVTVNPAD